ncbi:MAG: hypothetical protein ACJ72Z_10730 [Pyrinomonadaceae bacterium]
MNNYELFHGASAEKMLYNVRNFGLTADNEGKIYFSQNEWKNCLVHGADRGTGESYVVKVKITIPADARIDRSPRAGNPDALIVITLPQKLLRCDFIEMYVRSGKIGEFEIKTVPGPSIETYLAKALGQ